MLSLEKSFLPLLLQTSSYLFKDVPVSHYKPLPFFNRIVPFSHIINTSCSYKNNMEKTIPKEKFDSMEATIETLQNNYVMEHLEKSEQDIRNGRTRNIDGLIKELKGS